MWWLQHLPQFGEWGAQARHASIAPTFNTNIVGGGENEVPKPDMLVSLHLSIQILLGEGNMEREDYLEQEGLPIPYNPEKGMYQFVWDSDDHFSSG
jgi:hypothetical protein